MSGALVGALAMATAAASLVIAASLPHGSFPHLAFAHPDRRPLEEAGWRHGLRRWEAIRCLTAAAALAVALTGTVPLGVVAAVPILPSVWIRIRAEAAREGARRALARMIVTTEAALRSGTSLPDALRRATEASASPLAARPIVDALRGFDLGESLDGALVAAAEGAGDERSYLALSTLALGIAERLPRERLADLLAVLGDRLTFDERLDEEVRARAAGARQQQWLLAVLVPAIALYLTATVPTLASTLGTDLGRLVLIPAAATFEIVGIVLARRVLRAVRG